MCCALVASGVLYAVPAVIEINKMLRFFSHLDPDSLLSVFSKANKFTLKFFHVFVHSLTFWVASLYSESFSVLPPEICWHFRVLIWKRRLLSSYLKSLKLLRKSSRKCILRINSTEKAIPVVPDCMDVTVTFLGTSTSSKNITCVAGFQAYQSTSRMKVS